ncbi:ACT domain-containing protein [Pseudomonas sp.]|jgi:glycine cleavage system regulatory protein|uniref:glycine cleavage system protein R n=1 Tax=Pseudomonas sp. TaxID=306 RepID=UPI001A083FEA|nr:ACT domain-containing protein [Pseudomonas sp.]MBF0675144.1 ACT domain-containing protein [Pseudomonas sp.]
MEHLVFTIIAPDQPGLVERIARCVAEHGGNWLESRMARMAGQFAGILRVAVPAESHEELLEALQALNQHGIRVLAEPCGPEPACTWRPVQLELVGDDRPGILYDITRVLTELGVNIEKLETEVDAAPMSNEMLFRAHAWLALPLAVSTENLQASLETLADDLMVDVHLRVDDGEDHAR